MSAASRAEASRGLSSRTLRNAVRVPQLAFEAYVCRLSARHRRTMLPRTLEKGGTTEMTAQRRTPNARTEAALTRRSARIYAFLSRWGKRHWPERVTRFPKS